MSNLTGQHVGRYHIVEQLGEGGMASVYKAYDTRLERYVAVKVIRVENDRDASFLKRFEREAKALAKLSHPNIVHINDYGDQDGMPYVVMDYLPGGTLKQKMGQALPYYEAARLLAPVARALDHAHRNGIIHRDVKPANILMTSGGEPMLSDFGIAKILEGEQTSELTGTGVGIGTPEYMAPEQGAGGKIDERADVYALGVVFYELVTGRKPFKADTPMAVVIKHMTEPLPRPSSFVSTLPEGVEHIIYKAMAKKPEDRYQTMAQFARALEQLGQAAGPEQAETLVASSLTPGQATPPTGHPKSGSLPLVGTLLGGAVVIAILVLLVMCILGLALNTNFFGPKTTPTGINTHQTSTDLPTDLPSGLPTKANLTPNISPTPRLKITQSKTSTGGGMSGLVILSQKTGDMQPGDRVDLGSVVVPSGVQNLMIIFQWTNGTAEGVIIKPDGSKLDENSKEQDVFVVTSANLVNYNVTSPQAGKWSFSIQNPQIESDTLNYNFMVSYPK